MSTSLKTYADLRDFVQSKLDLQEESFISASELLMYCEEALKSCEAEVHKLNIQDQYFEAHTNIQLVSGQSDYPLPSNIYANKITRMILVDDNLNITISRATQRNHYEAIENMRRYPTSNLYVYKLVNNDVHTGTKIRLYPKAQKTTSSISATADLVEGSNLLANVSDTTGMSEGDFISGSGIPNGARILTVLGPTDLALDSEVYATAAAEDIVTKAPALLVWYIRSVSIPSDSTDLIDFPEFWPFIAQHMIVECLKKEIGNPRVDKEEKKLEQMRVQVLDTLSNMVPDQDDTIEKDLEAYTEGEY